MKRRETLISALAMPILVLTIVVVAWLVNVLADLICDIGFFLAGME